MENVRTAIITNEECKEIQTVWSEMNAMKELMKEDLHPSALKLAMDRFSDANTEYNKIWERLMPKYFQIDITREPSTTKWDCNFASCVLTLVQAE